MVQNITAYLDGTGNVSILPADVDNGSADNCGVPTLTLSNNTFTCANIGINNVTLTAADGSSNIATATAIVNVVDTTSPAASAQNISVYLDVSGSATITAADIDNGSADNCSFVNLSVNTDTFDCTDVGANSVILTVIDGNGNNSSATSTVTVLDTIKPIVITRNISVNLNNAGVDTITALDIDNGSFSNCGPVSLSLDSTIFDCSEVGPNTVTLIVTDANGNVDSATAIVTVIDSWRVSAFAQDITVYLDNLGQVTIDSLAIDAGSSDNCSIDRASLSQSTFNCSDIGGNSVEMLLIDPSGNRDSATAIVTVLDTTRPNVITQNINVYIDGQGFASINPSEVDNGSSDNCSAVTLSLDTSFFDCADIGANTVTLTVTDGSSNASSGTAIVTVIDTISPIAVAQNISVVLNASGIATIVAGDIDNGSSDNCSTLTLSVDSTTFDCSEIGVNTVVLTTTDGSNNTSTATVTVTVSDTSSPIAVAQNLFAYLDATGNVTIAAADVNNGSLDNCVSPTLSIDVSSFTCADIGPNTVTLTVTDGGSNFSTANSIVTVEDTISPVVIPQNIDIYLNRLGVASITPTQVDNGSSDNCSNVILSIDSSNFDCSEVGLNTVILTARDVNGNTSSAQAIVTIRDSISRTSSIQETSCGAYTWTQTGLTYSATGLYYDTIPTALGCDSILELDLTINNIGRDTVPVTSCNSYVWLSNNITYTSSGVYSDTLSGQASNGCDSIASIDLTIDVATVATDLQTACDSLVWIDGITYFTSNNTATFTIPNAVGCDSVITLDLTINNATSSTVTEGACGSFTWAQNGLSYLTTGLHNDTILNAAGCDSIVTLDLTINQPTASTLTETACETYTWVRNGETYTTSGNYNDTVPNAVGCDSVITLDLTINQSTASSFSITSCDTYNWALSGVTYTISGSYNDTIPNAVGCDSVLTLILTIDRSTVANAGEDQSICDIDLAVLSANSPINGSGTWSVLSGSGSFNNLNNPNTTVTGITQGLNQYTWSIVNGVCPIGVDTVIVSKANNPIVDAGPDQTIFQLDGAVLEATSNIDNVIGVMYSWEPAFYLSSNSSRVAETNSFLEETTEFMVQVTSPEGCVGSDRLVVNINELLTFSAAFTPNGDGKNDLWLIKNIQNPKILSHKVTIFDSYGSELFRSTNFQGWDGTYNGNALPVSSYYYSVEIKFADGESRVETGLVTILR
ncbi:MAG: gliding motility-associated-like protein [Vicingaceae bacterium]